MTRFLNHGIQSRGINPVLKQYQEDSRCSINVYWMKQCSDPGNKQTQSIYRSKWIVFIIPSDSMSTKGNCQNVLVTGNFPPLGRKGIYNKQWKQELYFTMTKNTIWFWQKEKTQVHFLVLIVLHKIYYDFKKSVHPFIYLFNQCIKPIPGVRQWKYKDKIYSSPQELYFQ